MFAHRAGKVETGWGLELPGWLALLILQVSGQSDTPVINKQAKKQTEKKVDSS